MGIRYPISISSTICGEVWRGAAPPFRRSRMGKEEVPSRGASSSLRSVRRLRRSRMPPRGSRKPEPNLDELRGAVSAEQARLESLRQGTRAIERDVAELRPIAAEIGRWEAADRAGKRAILDRICAKCDGLASRIREDIAGIWLKVEELRSRISRPLEYLMPKPKTERFGLDDVMREATRAAEAYNRSHAAQPTTSRSRGQSR